MNFFNNLFGGNNNRRGERNRNRQNQSSRPASAPPSNARPRPAASASASTSSSTSQQRQPRTQPRQQQQQQQQPPPQQQPQETEFQMPAEVEHILHQMFNSTAGINIIPEQFREQFAQAAFAQHMHDQMNGNNGNNGPSQEQQQFSPNAPPPASNKAIRTLPIVTVTPEDLVDENNRECCICFDEHKLGDRVVRLPCAHIFHPKCITEWLTKHCTCPICRYELPTSNPAYESSRRERMSTRKPRYAPHELQRMKTSDLIDLCQNKLRIDDQIKIKGYTKQEVIDLIINSDKVDIIATPPPMEMKNVKMLREMGVGKLKRTMKDAGVFFDSRDVIEKEDMVQIFLNSGRVVFEEEEEEEEEEVHLDQHVEDQKLQGNEFDSKDKGSDEHSYDRQEEVKRARLDEEGSRSSRSGLLNDQDVEIDDDENDENTQWNNNRPQIYVEDVSTRSLQLDQQSLHNDAVLLFPSEDENDVDGSLLRRARISSQDPAATSSATSDMASSRPSASTTYSFHESADITTRSVGELRELGQALGVDLTNCLEKREMIEMIVNALTRSGTGVRFGGGVVF